MPKIKKAPPNPGGFSIFDDPVLALDDLAQVDLSPNGVQMMRNFLFGVCGLAPSFTIEDRKEKCIQHIREVVGSKKVLVRNGTTTTFPRKSILVDFVIVAVSFPLRCCCPEGWTPPCAQP